MSAYTIACRAKLVDTCYDGEPTARQFGERAPLSRDNTFDGKTIVCDACYIAIMPFTKSGAALDGEIPEAIEIYRTNRDHVRATADLGKLEREAREWLERRTPGSPAHTSATACLAMVEAERTRRERVIA